MLGAVFIVLTVLSSALGQDCPIVQASDLGSTDTDALSNGGILGRTYSDPIAIQEMNIVCLSQGETRDTYRFASVVVHIVILIDIVGESLPHLDLECSSGVWISSSRSVSVSSATLTTRLRTDCISCIDSRFDPLSSTEEHCIGMFNI